MVTINRNFDERDSGIPHIQPGNVWELDESTSICIHVDNGCEQSFASFLREVWKSLPDSPRRAIADYWRKGGQEDQSVPVITVLKNPCPVCPELLSMTRSDGRTLVFSRHFVDEQSPDRVRGLIAFQLAYLYVVSENGCDFAEQPMAMFTHLAFGEWGYQLPDELQSLVHEFDDSWSAMTVME
jgi:hypothetical protein